MTEVLGAGYTTLTDLVAQVRLAVNDTSGGVNRKWSDEQIYLAMRNALAQAGNSFFYRDIYEDLDFVQGDVDYTLPGYIQRITRVERERRVPDISVSPGTNLDWEELRLWDQIETPGNNRLLLRKSYPAGNTRITYERDVVLPIVDLELAAAITDSQTTLTLTFNGTYNIYQIVPPAYFQINNSEIVKCTAITSPNTLTISRGALGTTAATGSAADTVTAVIIENDDRFASYVINASAAFLNMLLLQDANRGSDVAGNLTAMREFNDLAQRALRKKSTRPRPRPILYERARRRAR